jgi:hypothetical protein
MTSRRLTVAALGTILALDLCAPARSQTCPVGSSPAVTQVSNQVGPFNPPLTGLPLPVPRFQPAAGQTLIQADITVTATLSGSFMAENLSVGGGRIVHWCLASSLQVQVPVPMQPALLFNLSDCSTDSLGPFDGVLDYRGPSGVTHSGISTQLPQSLTITDPGVLSSVFSGSGTVDFTISALDSSSATGGGNLSLVFQDHDTLQVAIAYTYCAPGSDFCAPGLHGVISCPCANPQQPASSIKGCNNSASTGGAVLLSGGIASLAADTVVFSTTGETPNATTVFLQGNASLPSGLVFGQGVRCTGGSLERLYVKAASSGAASAPSGTDPSVSARSSALGDTITAGTHRYYNAYYRDSTVLGGCPSTSTFNTTQGQDVLWTP